MILLAVYVTSLFCRRSSDSVSDRSSTRESRGRPERNEVCVILLCSNSFLRNGKQSILWMYSL